MEIGHWITLGLSGLGLATTWGSLNSRVTNLEGKVDPLLGERIARLEAKVDILLGLKTKE